MLFYKAIIHWESEEEQVGAFCNAENNNIVINGTIVSYGADPASSAVPGSKGGLDDDLLTIKNKDNKTVVDFTSKPGTIKITVIMRKIWDKIVALISKVPYDKLLHFIAGLVIGVIAAGLAYLGNPKNMGFCIA